MNEARQVPPPSQSKKCKDPKPSPPVDGNTSAKRTKVSEPGGLVSNWKKKTDVGLLEHIARKRPIEFLDDEDDLVEGEFDRAEGPDALNAVRDSKPSTVRIDSKLVSRIIIYTWTLAYLQTVQLERHKNHPTAHLHSTIEHAAQQTK